LRIFRHYQDVPAALKGAVVALGNFDGVHRGHQALIAEAARHAAALDVPLGVIAFEPHPQEYFHPANAAFRLTPFRIKARLIAGLGADVMFALTFDETMAKKSAQDFVLDVLVNGLGVSCVVVGADFRFGHGRAGDITLLSYMGEMEGFGVVRFQPVPADAHASGSGKISSTRIRTALQEGRPEVAAALLGHWWAIESHVEHGDKRGRVIGFPTINMRWEGSLAPAFGVYAVRAVLMDGDKPGPRYDGVANFGIRPMFEISTPLLETYLFDFSGDLYGKHMAVELVAYLRPEAKFDSLDALKDQITRDMEAARAALAAAGPDAPALDALTPR
jgi:riboflavin kinase/FMN adenylyltransferase